MNNFCKALVGITTVFFAGCGQESKDKKPLDGFTSGNITILADESFEPIIAEEEFVFESLYREADIKFDYRAENFLLNAFLNDSARVAILSRKLTTAEEKILKDRKLPPITDRFAIDAVALVVSDRSADTLITVNQLKKLLNGETKTAQNIVFDNADSSLYKYLQKFAGSKPLNKQSTIYALKTNKEVIKYVSEHEEAIGIVGFSWLNDPDEDYAAYVNKVQIMGVRDEGGKYPAEYFKPSQSTLVLQQYPLSRDLYIINSTDRTGLGTGFASFLLSERGQRIILKSGLLPDSIPRREISIRTELIKK